MTLGPVQAQRLVRSYLSDGRTMEALVVAKKGALDFPSYVVDFRLLLAEVHLSRDDERAALEVLRATLVEHPSDARVQAALHDLVERS